MTSDFETWLETEAPWAANDWWHRLTDSERVDIFRGTTAGQTAYQQWSTDRRRDAADQRREVA